MESWTNRSNGPSETGVQTLVEGQCESKSDNSGPTILVFLKHPLTFLGRPFLLKIQRIARIKRYTDPLSGPCLAYGNPDQSSFIII